MPPIVWAIAFLGLIAAAVLLWRRAWLHAAAAREMSKGMPMMAHAAAGGGAAALPSPEGEPPVEPEPLLLTEEWRPAAPLAWPRWAASAAALALPAFSYLLTGPTPAAMLWLTAIATAGGIIAAERFKWTPASWLAAGGATAWAFLALATQRPEPDNPWPAAFMSLIALGGLIHMRRNLWAGLALAVGMAAASGAACILLGAAGVYGAALLAIVAGLAITGAAYRALEPALAAAWLIGCAGLWVLSGQDSSETWLTPAAVLMAALFLAIEALLLPQRGRDALIPAATGAIAAPFAIGVLSGVQVGPSGEAFEAGAYLFVAAVQAGVLYLCARRLGDLHALGFAIAPPVYALIACVVLALLTWLNLLWSAAPLAACAIVLAIIDKRAPHPIWNFTACAFALTAAINAIQIARLLAAGLEGGSALSFLLAGIAAPAALIGVAALLFHPRAAWTAAILEVFAITLGAMAIAAGVRWIATDQAPGIWFIGFAEAGVHISVWLAAAAALFLREERGAFFVRRGAAAVLCALAAAAFVWGPAAELNPWWGSTPTPAAGAPVANFLLAGYAAPALGFIALAAIASRRGWRRTHLGFVALAALSGGLWIVLEIRRIYYGADLSVLSADPRASLALSGAALAAALMLRAARVRVDETERTLTAALAAAIAVKLAFIDLALAPGAWRAGSIVLLALAGAALAAPRARAPTPSWP